MSVVGSKTAEDNFGRGKYPPSTVMPEEEEEEKRRRRRYFGTTLYTAISIRL